MTIAKVISGGQTGADQAGLRAAKQRGIPTGGWVPRGWKTDEGPAPWLAEYGCQEHASSQYAPRTISNVRDANSLIWFGNTESPGGRLTISQALSEGVTSFQIPFESLPVDDPGLMYHEHVLTLRAWLGAIEALLTAPMILLIAGNRERINPGIGAFAERLLLEVLHPQ